MVKPIVVEESPMLMAEVKEHLQKVKGQGAELSFRAAKAEEYLNEFTVLELKKALGLKKKLDKLGISRLKEEQTVKVIDVMPASVDEMKVVLQKYALSMSKKEMEQVLAVLDEFR